MARRPTDKRTQAAQKLVGHRIRELRKGLDLSQEQLAHQCGVHRTFVGHIERGEVNPTLGTLIALADGLAVEVDALVVGLGGPNPGRPGPSIKPVDTA